MVPGSHGTTFGGNPLVCAAGNAVINIMKRDSIVENTATMGERWMEDLRSITSDKVTEVRGHGLIIGIEMDSPDSAVGVQEHCFKNGVLVNVCHGNVVRLIPPLIISDNEKDRFTSLFKEHLG